MSQPTSNGSDLNQQNQQQQQWVQQQQQSHQYQQQWMAMQYPATAMAMMQQQMMMYPQHYMPYLHHHQQHHYQQPPPHQQQHHIKHHTPPQHQHKQQQLSADEIKTIWLGDLHHWMDENYLHNCFAHTGEVVSAKVIRNKLTGQSEGYGFVEFYSRATAEKVLQNYSGATMPNTDQPFRMNWASFSMGERRSSDATSDLSVFVGDLAIEVTDAILQETFATRYSSIKGAKVVIDANTGRSKGYGFVRFGDENEKTRAMTEMNGVYCSSRPMRVGVATPKKTYGYPQQYSSQSQAVVLAGGHPSNGAVTQGSQSEGDLNNTTIPIAIIISDVLFPLDTLAIFYAFCRLGYRKSAEEAIQALNGTVIGKQTVRLSWGRSPGNKHWRNDSDRSHYGGQGYGGNGYAVRQNQDIAINSAATLEGDS
ncbi:hypothetical protein TanjilG_23113 [Lupinus angustifolius]|uniref:RRM domain-containing protein n=1 Tax=Lupinus angustifolius TaxID=3871 RepID=A0A1J7GT52_LUPAN|nr:hypothetical protein TanjilG_23113 [Lupinus angustifolius]